MGNLKIDLQLISREKALKINQVLIGEPTENRVVILSPKDVEKRTESGLFVPGTIKEGIPLKGVIVGMGPITDEYVTYAHQIKVGSIVTYGQYAGKEIEPNFTEEVDTEGMFTILSLNEILYVEPNNK